MSLSAYARNAYGIGCELRDMLDTDAFSPFLARLNSDAAQVLCDFRRDNDAIVREIATSQPKPRQKVLSNLPLEDQFWAIASAAQMAFEAASVLHCADTHLLPRGSYRDMIDSVQTVLLAQYTSPDADWPFPTLSPFHPDYAFEQGEE